MLLCSLVVLTFIQFSIANHGYPRGSGSGSNGGGSSRYGGHGHNGGPPPDIGPPPDVQPPSTNSFSPLDCPISTSTNAYCDQMLESLLGLVIGVPVPNGNPINITKPSYLDSNGTIKQMLSQLRVKGKSGSNGQAQSPSDNSNVTQICCFLMSFSSARENCCNQVASFCQDVSGVPGSCGCYGSSGGPYGGGPYGGNNGGGSFGGNNGGSSGHGNGHGSGRRGGSRGGSSGHGSGSNGPYDGSNGPDFGNY